MPKTIGAYYRFLSRKLPTPERTRRTISFVFIAAAFLALLSPAASSYASARTLGEISTAQFTPVETTTLPGFQFPLKNYAISQYFYFLHRGIDLQAPAKTPVYPIEKGQIKQINQWFVGYGKHIIVEHSNGFSSLYAHLSTIEVNVGDTVDRGTIIGRVGATGWATGNHLHLEIYENGRTLNPLEVLPEKRV